MVPTRIRRPGTWKDCMIRGVHIREVDRTRKQAIVGRVSTFLEQSPASRPRGESVKAAVPVRAKSSQPCGTKSELKRSQRLDVHKMNEQCVLCCSLQSSDPSRLYIHGLKGSWNLTGYDEVLHTRLSGKHQDRRADETSTSSIAPCHEACHIPDDLLDRSQTLYIASHS